MVAIRSERAEDIDAIHAIHLACFPSAGEARLVDSLRADGQLVVSLVAEDANQVIGHVAFSPVTAANGAVGIGLAPVAVLPSHQRQGIAASLIEKGLMACRQAGYGWVVALGDPAYYARFGFKPAPEAGLTDEYGGGVAFQMMELVAGSLPRGAGLVRYATAFAALE